MGANIKHKVASGAVAGLALLFGLAPAVSAATITDSDRYTAVDKAVAYLSSQQAADGSIASFDDTGEWAAIALSAAGVDIATVNNQGVSLLQYFENTKNLDSSSYRYAYDIEQRLLALKSAGFDAADFEGVNYDSLLEAQYNSNAIAGSSTTYDDIFGIMILSATANTTLKAYLSSAVDTLVGYQQADGGFCSDLGCPYGEDVDTTAMAYGALAAAQTAGVTSTTSATPLSTAMASAHDYIFASEVNDMFGSYGPNYSTTSLVAAALNTAGEDTSDIATAILAGQDTNGGIRYDSDPSDPYGSPSVYNTDFGILALLGTNWLLNPAPIARPTMPATGGQGGDESDTNVAEEPSVAETHPIIPYVSNGPATPAPVEQVAAAETDTPNTDQATEDSNSSSNQTLDNKGNILKYIGYGLIVLAVAGLAGYTILTRQSNDKG